MFSPILVVTVLAATCAFVKAADQCPQGWHHFQRDNMCIQVFDAEKSFHDARSSCQEQGADLVEITDDAKRNFVLGLHARDFWNGVWDADQNRKWTFISDGTPVTNYHPWSRGEPNNWQNNEYCVGIYAGASSYRRGLWNDANCNTGYTFVCEKAPEAEPITHCPMGWDLYERDNTCIRGYGTEMSFNDARNDCQHLGADLVKLTDDNKKDFVLGIHKKMFWAGVWDQQHNRQWSYVDGTPVSGYHPWSRGEPNNWQNNEYCVNVYADDRDSKKGLWNDGNCQTKYSFVCEKPSAGTPAVVAPPITHCPMGWDLYERDNTCIRGYGTEMSFNDARNDCQHLGADLVKLTDDNKKDFVLGIHKKMFWAGVWDQQHNRQWSYVDGTPVSGYHPWSRGEPNNWQNNEYCVNVYADDRDSKKGLWNDGNCQTKYSFVCEKPSAGTPAVVAPQTDRCFPGWHYFARDNKCIRAYDFQKSYFKARDDCHAVAAEMVQLKDADKADFVIGLQSQGLFWNGAKAKDGTRDFYYIDGTPLGSYKPWQRGEPNDFGYSEDCIFVYAGDSSESRRGQWNDVNCVKRHRVVCEKDNEPETPETPKEYGPCPSRWTRFNGDGKCLKAMGGEASWGDARKRCQSEGGDLVMIKSRAKQDFMNDFRKATIWIGISDIHRDGKSWHYVDGSPVGSFSAWASDEPDNYYGGEFCVKLYNGFQYTIDREKAGTWGDYSCDIPNSYVCEKDWP